MIKMSKKSNNDDDGHIIDGIVDIERRNGCMMKKISCKVLRSLSVR